MKLFCINTLEMGDTDVHVLLTGCRKQGKQMCIFCMSQFMLSVLPVSDKEST